MLIQFEVNKFKITSTKMFPLITLKENKNIDKDK